MPRRLRFLNRHLSMAYAVGNELLIQARRMIREVRSRDR